MNTHEEEVLGLLRNGGQEGIHEGCASLDRPQFPEIERRIQRLVLGSVREQLPSSSTLNILKAARVLIDRSSPKSNAESSDW